MIVQFDASFLKGLKKINDQSVKNGVLKFIEKTKEAENLNELSSVK